MSKAQRFLEVVEALKGGDQGGPVKQGSRDQQIADRVQRLQRLSKEYKSSGAHVRAKAADRAAWRAMK